MNLNTINIAGQIADLKDVDYKNTLAIASLIELLVAKGIISREEFAAQALKLERASLSEIALARRRKTVPPQDSV